MKLSEIAAILREIGVSPVTFYTIEISRNGLSIKQTSVRKILSLRSVLALAP